MSEVLVFWIGYTCIMGLPGGFIAMLMMAPDPNERAARIAAKRQAKGVQS